KLVFNQVQSETTLAGDFGSLGYSNVQNYIP
ncbi:hypothetical protein SAMN05192552_10568, partial [Natrinema hispanicum]